MTTTVEELTEWLVELRDRGNDLVIPTWSLSNTETVPWEDVDTFVDEIRTKVEELQNE